MESVQRFRTRNLHVLRNLPHLHRLHVVDLETLERQQLVYDLNICYKYLHVLIETDSRNFLCVICLLELEAMACSSSDGVAIRYLLPVLRMMSDFHTVSPIARHAKQQREDNATGESTASISNQILLNDKVLVHGFGPGSKSDI